MGLHESHKKSLSFTPRKPLSFSSRPENLSLFLHAKKYLSQAQV